MEENWLPVTTELHPALLIEARIAGEEESSVHYTKDGLCVEVDLEHLGIGVAPFQWNSTTQQYEYIRSGKPVQLERPSTSTRNQLRLQILQWKRAGYTIEIQVNGEVCPGFFQQLEEEIGELPMHVRF
jgi:hypothetical protein